MANIKKIKRGVLALFLAVSLVILLFIIQIRDLIFVTMEWEAGSIAITLIGVIIILAALIATLILLYSIKKDETPFNIKNVKRLKIIAVLLITIEPYFYISQWVYNKFYPIVLDNNIQVSTHTSLGGIVLVSGLVVYCISLVFEYGISLQKQYDETL